MKELIDALAKAQGNMANAVFNRVNPHFKSKYADLASIRDAVIPHLSAEGIALIQAIDMRDGGYVLVTKIMKGEDVLTSDCPIVLGGQYTTQQFGSALTYARRYSLAAIAGIASEEDDDANAATETGEAKKPKPGDGVRKAATEENAVMWFGPQKKTELQSNLKAFAAQLGGLDSLNQLEDLLTTFHDTLEQAKKDKPGWMERDATTPAEFVPLNDRIEAKRRFLESVANMSVG